MARWAGLGSNACERLCPNKRERAWGVQFNRPHDVNSECQRLGAIGTVTAREGAR